MTDKEQIIIDGVNVSECKHLSKVVNEEPYCNMNEEHLYTCSSDENCYFKQRARKTQECEALKKRNEDNERFYLKQYAKKDSEVLDLTHKLNVKTQECEKLKAQVDTDYEAYSQELKTLRDIIKNKEKRNAELFCELKELKELVQQAKDAPICFQCEQEPCIRQERDRYYKALEEIEGFRKEHCDFWCEGHKILNIINKAKGKE